MTVIAWDGIGLAADRLGASEYRRINATKIFTLPDGEVAAFTGRLDKGLALIEWLKGDRNPEAFKKLQGDDFSFLIVASKDGVVWYENEPIPIRCEDPFMAWGTGSGVAIGVMAMGGDARLAVEKANELASGCGGGVDYLEVALPERPINYDNNVVHTIQCSDGTRFKLTFEDIDYEASIKERDCVLDTFRDLANALWLMRCNKIRNIGDRIEQAINAGKQD